MQNCAEIVSQTIFHRCVVDIILLPLLLCTICIICGILCGKTIVLMYSYHKKHFLKQKQMIGYLHRGIVVQLKGVVSKFKHYNNKKNNRWHFNRNFTGYFTRTTTMRTMWNTTSIMMSGKLTIWWNKLKTVEIESRDRETQEKNNGPRNHECFKGIRRVIRSTGRILCVCKCIVYVSSFNSNVCGGRELNVEHKIHICTYPLLAVAHTAENCLTLWMDSENRYKNKNNNNINKSYEHFLRPRYNSTNFIWMCAWLAPKQKQNKTKQTHICIPIWERCVYVCVFCIVYTRKAHVIEISNCVPIGSKWRQLTRDLLFNGCCMHVFVLVYVRYCWLWS